METPQPRPRRLGEEVPEEQADDQVQVVVGIGAEDEGEDDHEHREHGQRLGQGPEVAGQGPGIAGLEVRADQGPDEAAEVGVGRKMRRTHVA